MRTSEERAPGTAPLPANLDQDALLCALVLAPNTYARNRFFPLFEKPTLARLRRRAARVRGIIRQLTGQGRLGAEIVGERRTEDRVLIRYEVAALGYVRTASLAPIEAALVRYVLHKGTGRTLDAEDHHLIEHALSKLGKSVEPFAS